MRGCAAAASGSRSCPAPESVPHLIREEGRITIPQDSALRSKLTVGAVGEKEIQRSLVLPAVVEADPARLAKILPPLAGRITQLKVQLGERVELGQRVGCRDEPADRDRV